MVLAFRRRCVVVFVCECLLVGRNSVLKIFILKIIVVNNVEKQDLNKIILRKKQLEETLVPEILKNLKNNIWPLEIEKIFCGVEEYNKISSSLLTSMATQKFTRNESNQLIDRTKIQDCQNWTEILGEAEKTMDSLLTKILSVELISISEESLLPGVDNICFLGVPPMTKIKSVVLKYLKDLTTKLEYDLSFLKENSGHLDSKKKYRKYLKSSKGKLYLKSCKMEYDLLLKNPCQYLNELRTFALEKNNNLKMELLTSLKTFQLKRYSSGPVFQNKTITTKKKLKLVKIPTLKDRTVQIFLKLVMEPYLEPLGDRNSFGSRPGRNAQQAVSYLRTRLMTRNSSISQNKRVSLKFKSTIHLKYREYRDLKKYSDELKQKAADDIIKNKNISNENVRTLMACKKKLYYVPYHLLCAGIGDCHEKISHEWLLANVPMPTKYKFLLARILKFDLIEKSNKILLKKENSSCGLLKSGPLSSVLVNWALDGIESLVFDTVVSIKNDQGTGYYDIEKFNYYKKIRKSASDEQLRVLAYVRLQSTSWAIRYLSDFVIGVKGELPLKTVQDQVNLFLKERNLTLSKGQTKFFKWKSNAKFDFLSWTFHYLVPKRVSWIIRKSKLLAGSLRDWVGIYVYPSKTAVSNLKFKIKFMTNFKNSSKSELVVISSIADLLFGWSSYFSSAPNQGSLRLAIDWYVFKRMKGYIYKKYGNSFGKHYLKLNKNFKDGSRKKSIGLTWFKNTRETRQVITRLIDYYSPAMFSKAQPKLGLLNSSYLSNPAPYIEHFLNLIKLNQSFKSKLFFKNQKRCALCNKPLVIWKRDLFDSYDFFMDGFNETSESLFEIFVKDYYVKINQYSLNPNSSRDFDRNYPINVNSKSCLVQIILLKPLSSRFRKMNDLWQDLEKDHLIPIKMAANIESLKKILTGFKNLRFVHKFCHKQKTFGFEEQQLLKNYRKIYKSLVSSEAKTEIECNKLHLKTILELEKTQQFEYLKKDAAVKDLFKNYLVEVERLNSKE